MSILFLFVLIPLLAAAGILLKLVPARRTAFGAAALNFALALGTFLAYQPVRLTDGKLPDPERTFRFLGAIPVVPDLDLKFLVGADGLGVMMILLAALVTLCAVWMSAPLQDNAAGGEPLFYACLLFISAGALGAFVSLDLFFFYAFHELALIPTFLLIGLYGHGDDRMRVAWKITIYLALGSFVLLLGLIGLYLCVPADVRTFDLTKLYALAREGRIAGGSAQRWPFLLILLGFGTLVSLFPFHTWAPDAYATAPTPATMLHAGVLKKFGLFGLLRVALPLLPDGARQWTTLLLVLLVGNILYVGFVTIAQRRLDLMLGYSSVMHMGYAFLGIATLNVVGLSGAALMMFAHGLSIAALFAVAGEIRQRRGTMQLSELGGLGKTMPFAALAFGLATFASIGLPGFANFASETMVFFGAWGSRGAHVFRVDEITGALRAGRFDRFQIATVCGLWGVVMSAVYMLRAYRQTFQGPLRAEPVGSTETGVTASISNYGANVAAVPVSLGSAGRGDLPVFLRWPLVLLLAALVLVGFQPKQMLDKITPGLAALINPATSRPDPTVAGNR